MKPAATTKKGKKRMRTETVDGTEYLIAENGNDTHLIDIRAIASWGLLLGMTDPGEIVAAILRFKEEPALPGQPNVWTPLYEALDTGLDALSAAGVPPEHMEDLLDPALGSPVPGPGVCAELEKARGRGRAKVLESPDVWGDTAAEVAEALADKVGVIAEARLAFVDKLAPVYEVPVSEAPQSEPAALFPANWQSTGIVPGILSQ